MKRVIGAYQYYFINSCTDLKIIQNKKLAKKMQIITSMIPFYINDRIDSQRNKVS